MVAGVSMQCLTASKLSTRPARPQPPPHPKRLFVAGDGLPHLSTALVGEPLTTRVMLCCTRKAETGCGALWCR